MSNEAYPVSGLFSETNVNRQDCNKNAARFIQAFNFTGYKSQQLAETPGRTCSGLDWTSGVQLCKGGQDVNRCHFSPFAEHLYVRLNCLRSAVLGIADSRNFLIFFLDF
jgi:hypothetical protein